MKDEDIKLPEIDQTTLRFHVKGESPKIWDHIEKWSVSKAGLQAITLANNIDLAIAEAMQEYARQAVRMNLEENISMAQQAAAWVRVHKALSDVRPGWPLVADTGPDSAVKTILDLGAKADAATPKPSDPEPFDLARAKAGEPIVTRDGRKVRFLAHAPELEDLNRVVVAIEGDRSAESFYENGCYIFYEDGANDLFMAPKPKRTVWVNVWIGPDGDIGVTHPAYETENAAYTGASKCGDLKHVAIAHPIEIDA